MFKKFLKKKYVFCLIIFLKIIKPFIHIRIGEIETRAIGHFTKAIDIYLAEQELLEKKEKKYFDIWFCNKKISNYYLLNIWKKYLRIYPRIFLEPVFNYLIENNKFDFLTPYRHWKTDSNIKINANRCQYHDVSKVLKKTKTRILFSQAEHELAKKKLREIGIDSNKPVYGFFARDDSYRAHSSGENESQSLRSQSLIRNFDINDFSKGIEFMEKKNFVGIRVGNKTSDKLNLNKSTIIDYSNSKNVSDFLDIYLANKCEFYCGGDSGMHQLPSLFRKQSILVNAFFYSIADQDDGFVKLIILKKLYSLKEKKFVKYSNIIKMVKEWETKEDYGLWDNNFIKNGYKIVNNTPIEIKEVIEEFYNRNNNLWEKKSDEDRLNDLINNFMIKNNCNKLENIKVGYEFLKNNEKLFI